MGLCYHHPPLSSNQHRIVRSDWYETDLGLDYRDKNTKTVFKDAFDGQYELGVIETTEQKNKSIISLYHKELEKVHVMSYPFRDMAPSFAPPIRYQDAMYVAPCGVGGQRKVELIFAFNVKTGESTEHDMGISAMNAFSVTDDHLFGVNTMNAPAASTIAKRNKETGERTTLEIPQVLIQSIEANHDTLIAIGTLLPSPSNPDEADDPYAPERKAYLYEIKVADMSIQHQYDIPGQGVYHQGLLIHQDHVYFSSSRDENEVPNSVSSIFSLQTKTFEHIPLPAEEPSQIIQYGNRLFIVHCNFVQGEGNQTSIYHLDTKQIKLIELEHAIYQLAIKDDMTDILGDPLDADYSGKQDHVYQYRLHGDALEFINKVDVVPTRDDRLHFWVGGIFLK